MQKFFVFLLLIIASQGCTKNKKKLKVSSPDFVKAEALHERQNDSAFYYFNKAANNTEDSLELALSYHYMAWIQSDHGDHFGSQESVLKSLEYFNENKPAEHYWIALNYNILGTTNLNLKLYDNAIAYYDLALKFDTAATSRMYYLNNKALTYQKKKEYDKAITIYQALLDTKIEPVTEYARILSNLVRTKWLKDSNYQAAPLLWEALQIRRSNQDEWGLNASYAHLSDYYARINRDSSLFYAYGMHKMALQLNSPDDELESLEKIIKREQPDKAATFISRYINLNDSLQQARITAKNQFALIRYNSEKSIRILQADNTRKRTRILRQRIILIGVLFIFLFLVTIAAIWYRKRKQRFRLEALHAIQEHKLRTSEKIHDVVANGLYRLMTEIQHSKIEKEALLDKIEDLYEYSRDISYEPATVTTGTYGEKISDLLSAFSGPSTKVLIVGNNQDFWEGIAKETRDELEYILQELMINMKKHSQAHNVLVKFDRDKNRCRIRYSDDGVGVNKPLQPGNGLRNTGNRILALGGTINFEEEKTNGFGVTISFSTTTDDN